MKNPNHKILLASLAVLCLAACFRAMPAIAVHAAVKDCEARGGVADIIYGSKCGGGPVKSVACFTTSGVTHASAANTPDSAIDARKEEARDRCSLTGSRCDPRRAPERLSMDVF